MSKSIEAKSLRKIFRDTQSISIINELPYLQIQVISQVMDKFSKNDFPPLIFVLKELIQNYRTYKLTERQYFYLVEAYNIAKTMPSYSMGYDVSNYLDIPWSIEEGNEFARKFPSPRR